MSDEKGAKRAFSAQSAQNEKLVQLFLRLGLASVFLYAAIAGTLNPSNWIGYLPQFMTKIAPADLLLKGFDLYELLLALWLLSGKKLFIPAVISALTMVGIIILNPSQLDITFRDVGIAFMAAALAAASI